MRDQRVGIVVVAGADGARNGRRNAAADAAVGHHGHQHQDRKDQRNAGERRSAEIADVERLGHPDGHLRHQHQDRGPGQAEHRGQDGPMQDRLPGAHLGINRRLGSGGNRHGRCPLVGKCVGPNPLEAQDRLCLF